MDFGPCCAATTSKAYSMDSQCILIHDCTTGTLILAHKVDLLREIEHQLTLGPDSLAEEDRFLLEFNFDNLTTSRGATRVLAISYPSSRRDVTHLRRSRGYSSEQTRHQAEMGIKLNTVPAVPCICSVSRHVIWTIPRKEYSWKKSTLSLQSPLQRCFA